MILRSNLVFGKTGFTSINDALAVAEKGDTIHVSDGRYGVDVQSYGDLLPAITIKGVRTTACTTQPVTTWQHTL